MIKTEATATIGRPVEEIWAFISDSSNLDKWFVLKSGEEVRKTFDGQMALGSTIQLKGDFGGRNMLIEARVTEFEPKKRITIEYVTGSFRGSRKTFQVEPDASGENTKLTHINEGEFQGLWKVLGFVLKPVAANGLERTTKAELEKIVMGTSA